MSAKTPKEISMTKPCRGDCNQGRNCYCGAVPADAEDAIKTIVALVCVCLTFGALVAWMLK